MTLHIARPVESMPVFSEKYEVDGSEVTVTIGHTDARITLRVEGPGPGEFTFLALDPRTFGALCTAVCAFGAKMQESE